jgi:hypothetical protein
MEGVAFWLTNLGWLALSQNDYERANTAFEKSLVILQDVGEKFSIAICMEGLATIAGLQERNTTGIRRAARLWGVAEIIRETIGAPLTSDERTQYEQAVTTARTQLDDAAWAAAWAAGRAMLLEQAVAYALEEADDA